MRPIACAVLALAMPLLARAEAGTVDWQRKVVKCTGMGAPNLRDASGNVAVARIGAERAAKLDALRNCMEALKGVSIKSGETVGSAVAGDSGLRAKVEGLVKGFKVVGSPRYFSDGGVEMDVEVPLEGALSDLLLPKGEPKEAATTTPTPPATPPPAATATPAPPLTQTLSQKGEGSAALRAAPGATPAAHPALEPAGTLTGLILDARGQKVAPALAPRIFDEDGNEIYGPAALSAEARQKNGAAAYARSIEVARKELRSRIGEKPAVVKAIKAQGTDLVVNHADAAVLRGASPSLSEGRVVIVTD